MWSSGVFFKTRARPCLVAKFVLIELEAFLIDAPAGDTKASIVRAAVVAGSSGSACVLSDAKQHVKISPQLHFISASFPVPAVDRC